MQEQQHFCTLYLVMAAWEGTRGGDTEPGGQPRMGEQGQVRDLGSGIWDVGWGCAQESCAVPALISPGPLSWSPLAWGILEKPP